MPIHVPKTTRQILGMPDDDEAQQTRKTTFQTLQQAMQREQQPELTALQQQAIEGAQRLDFDREALEQTLVGETEREAQLARERLARQFSIEPGGALTGQSQRAFETLEGAVLGTIAEIRTQLHTQAAEQARQNLSAMASTYAQFNDAELQQEAQRLGAAQMAGQLLNQEEQTLIAAFQVAEATAHDAAQLQQQREMFEAEQSRAMQEFAQQLGLSYDQLAEEVRRAQAGEALQYEQLRAQIEQFTQQLSQRDREFWETLRLQQEEMALREAQFAEAQQQFQAEMYQRKTEFAQQLGLSVAQLEEEIRRSQAGEELQYEQLRVQIEQFMVELQQRQHEFNQTYGLEERRVELTEDQFTEATRQFDVELERRIDEFAAQIGLSRDQLDEEIRRARAGEAYQDAALAQQLDQFNAELALQQVRHAAEQQRFLVEQTGRIGYGGTLTAAELGIDTTGRFNQITGTFDMTSEEWAKYNEQFDMALSAAGLVNLTDRQRSALMRGEEIAVDGAQTLAARQMALEATIAQNRMVLERRSMQLQEQVAEAEATGRWDDVATLDAERFALDRAIFEASDRNEQERIQQQWSGQLHQQMIAEAQLTGSMGSGAVSARDFGLETLNFPANQPLSPEDQERLEHFLTVMPQRFQARAGRMPTDEEVAALMRGQTLALEGARTIAQQRHDMEQAILRAEQTGTFMDPWTGQDVTTLRAQQQEFEQTMAQQQQAFQERMAMADQTGYVSVGTGGQITAQDLGVNVQYVQDMPPHERQNTIEAQKLTESFRSVFGTAPSLAVLDYLLSGGSWDTGQEEVRIQTMSARLAERELALSEGSVLGELYGRQTQAAKEFESELRLREDMTEAEIARIFSGIEMSERELAQRAMEFATTTQLNLSEMLGVVAGHGDIAASDMGILVPERASYPDDESYNQAVAQTRQTLSDTFSMLEGRPPDDRELGRLLNGQSVRVSGRQTLGALSLNAQISQQALEREADMLRFAKAHELDHDRFVQATAEADRNYALTAQQVAQQYDLDVKRFLQAKAQIDAELGGTMGYSGPLTLNDLMIEGVNDMSQAQLLGIVQDRLLPLMPPGTSAREVADLAQELTRGRTIQVESRPTFAREQWEQQITEATREYNLQTRAMALQEAQFQEQIVQFGQEMQRREEEFAAQIGLNHEQLQEEIRRNRAGEAYQDDALAQQLNMFVEELDQRQYEFGENLDLQLRQFDLSEEQLQVAMEQFDRQFAETQSLNYAQLFGTALDDPENKTLNYRQFEQASQQFAENEASRDQVWNMLMREMGKVESKSWHDLVSEGIVDTAALAEHRIEAGLSREVSLGDLGVSAEVESRRVTQEDLGVLSSYDPSSRWRTIESALVQVRNSVFGGDRAALDQAIREANPELANVGNPAFSLLEALYMGRAVNWPESVQGISEDAVIEAIRTNFPELQLFDAPPVDAWRLQTDTEYRRSYTREVAYRAEENQRRTAMAAEMAAQLLAGDTAVYTPAVDTKEADVQFLRQSLMDRYGTAPGNHILAQMIEKQAVGFDLVTGYGMSDEQLAMMANFVNGHGMNIAQNNKSSGWAQLAGTAVGIAAGPLAGAAWDWLSG